MLWLIFIILIIFFIYINRNRLEHLNTFNGRMAVDDMYYYDQIFDDVTYYPNRSDFEHGMDDCRAECPGNCVEFGVTGNGYCFPY